MVLIKPVPDWPGYHVSSLGIVFGPRRQLKPVPEDGYQRVRLYRDGHKKWFMVHVIVMELFGSPKPGAEYQVDHKDGNKENNRLENLEWVTPQENSRRRTQRLGGNPKARKGHLPCNNCGERPRRLVSGVPSSECKECHAYKERGRYSRRTNAG